MTFSRRTFLTIIGAWFCHSRGGILATEMANDGTDATATLRDDIVRQMARWAG